MQTLDQLLAAVLERKASDLHLKVGRVPVVRVNGLLQDLPADRPLDTAAVMALFGQMMTGAQLAQLEQTRELDLAYRSSALDARFRCNVFYQKGDPGAVLRHIPTTIPTLDSLGFSDVLKELVHAHQGMILITGPTGSGKSTTLAAMINEINTHQARHIMTIEDPIEFVHTDCLSLINQREVGMDTASFNEAAKRAMRQDPDVILIGEMRDAESISIATRAAETGHLVFSTLHTNDARQSIDRIVNTYPPGEHFQVRMTLGMVLRAVVSQRLIPHIDGKGRVAVQEIMLNTPTIRKLIEEADLDQIGKMIEESSTYYKMQSMNQALLAAWREGVISEEEAIKISTSPSDLRLKMSTEQFGRVHGSQADIPAGWEPRGEPDRLP